MRIKTSKYVLENLDELKSFLQMENNAQVLKHAITIALISEHDEIEIPLEDGFEIATNVLFGDENKYYKYIISEMNLTENCRTTLLYLIDKGIHEIVARKDIAKSDRTTYLKKLLEDKCI